MAPKGTAVEADQYKEVALVPRTSLAYVKQFAVEASLKTGGDVICERSGSNIIVSYKGNVDACKEFQKAMRENEEHHLLMTIQYSNLE